MSLRANDAQLAVVLEVIAKQLKCEVREVGDFVLMGQLTDQDSAYAVARFRRLDSEQLQSLVSGRSGNGRAVVSPDGLVVLIDRVDVVRETFAVLRAMEAVESATWAIQLSVIRVSESFLNDVGFDVTPAVEIGAAAAFASGGLSAAADGVQGLASVRAVLRAAAEDRRASIVADPYFLLTDGAEAVQRLGGEVSFRNTITTPANGGPVQTQVVERVQTGSLVRVKCRELSDDRARLFLEVENTSVDGFRDGLPQLRREQGTHTVDVSSGGTYLIAHTREQADENIRSTWLRLGRRDSSETAVVQLWASVYRVAIGKRTAAGSIDAKLPSHELPHVDDSDEPHAEAVRNQAVMVFE